MRSIVSKRYEEFDLRRKQVEAEDADLQDIKELEAEAKLIAAQKR